MQEELAEKFSKARASFLKKISHDDTYQAKLVMKRENNIVKWDFTTDVVTLKR